ncbi:hypothetical protein BC826DRAFT_1188097 [Russula brevipes]|nr:hypothetical protein BC826DRAFT_1188097 [Russula brevipes]
MGINIHDPLVQIKVTESVCGFVAICMTLLRLWLRRSRPWWDDAWAFFSLVWYVPLPLCSLLSRDPHARAPILSSLIIQFAAVFMHVENPEDISRLSRIASYYLMATTFYAVIWTARISILFSIIRIDPDPIMRRRLKWLAAAFVGALAFFLAQLLWTCEGMHDGWKNARSPQCHLPKVVAICQLVSDILSDLALILLPIRLIRGIKEKRLRWRLVFIFSTAIVTTIVSLVHAAYIITRGGIPVIISALVEDCMSLTVANLPVVATASFRRLSGVSRHEHPDGDGQRWSSFKFRTRTQPPGATTATHWTTGFGAGAGGVSVHNTTTEFTGTSVEMTKNTIPAFAVGPDGLFSGTMTKGDFDGDAEKGQVLEQVRPEDGGVVRIDVLPYPREPPPPPASES